MPIARSDWSTDAALSRAIPDRNPCMEGWESQTIFNCDYQLIHLSDDEFTFLKACDGNTDKTVAQLIQETGLSIDQVRSLLQKQLILLSQINR